MADVYGHAPDRRCDRASVNRIPHQMTWESIMAEMSDLHIDKAIEYGTDRYSSDWTEEEQGWMIYSDVYRKFIRLRQQMRRGDKAGMRETLLDLGNYCILGIQIFDIQEERGRNR